MSLVQVNSLSFSYGQIRVIHDLTFSINEGEICCLFGPNGCGKSTLLECLLGLLHTKNGTIVLGGINPQSAPRTAVARVAAYVPQVHQKTFPYLVKDIVMMGRAAYTGLLASPGSDDMIKADEAMAAVGIMHLRNKPYVQLSGGEMQLVMIARALAQETPIMVLDEPTAHLDFRNDLVILEKVTELVKKKGLTVIMATHTPNQAFYFETQGVSTRVALMHNCTFADFGPPSEVLTEKNLQHVFHIRTKVVAYPHEGKQIMRQIIPLATVNNAGTEAGNA